MDINVKTETNGKATMTTTMGADIYPMVKAGAAQRQSADDDDFCKDEGD